jgi:hypothetical protein
MRSIKILIIIIFSQLTINIAVASDYNITVNDDLVLGSVQITNSSTLTTINLNLDGTNNVSNGTLTGYQRGNYRIVKSPDPTDDAYDVSTDLSNATITLSNGGDQIIFSPYFHTESYNGTNVLTDDNTCHSPIDFHDDPGFDECIARVWGDISIPANTPAGTYSGILTVDSSKGVSTTISLVVSHVTSISITENVQLDFATIITGGSSGTISMDNVSLVSVTGDGNSVSGVASKGSLLISGDSGLLVTILIDSGSLTGTGSAITFTPDVSISSSFAILDGFGEHVFEVYGTLAFGSSQSSGLYTGSYLVTVNY